MKKFLALTLALLMVLALCACGDKAAETTETETAKTEAPAEAAPAAEPAAEAPAESGDGYTVTLINGMDGSEYETYTVAAGEDFVFTISCAPPCDMGAPANGEEGSGVTTTSGKIAYSNITTGGPNAYPTFEVVTISGIDGDCTVTVTPNPDETDASFPEIILGEAEPAASGEPSGEPSEEPAA